MMELIITMKTLKNQTQNNGFLCPVCKRHSFVHPANFEECPVCEWVNDGYQADHPDALGENTISLNEAIETYKMCGTING